MSNERHPTVIRRIGPGQKLTAGTLDEPRRAIERHEGGVNPPQQVFTNRDGDLSGLLLRQFRVLSVQGDYLTCNPFNGKSYDEKVKILIAKPYLLRKSLTERNGITYTFASDTAGTAGTERTATEGSDTETQVVVPSFVEGDVIFAARGVTGGTGVVFTASNNEEKDIGWLDANVDGRAWAKKDGT